MNFDETLFEPEVRHRQSRFEAASMESATDRIAAMFKVKGSKQRIAMQRRFVSTQERQAEVFSLLQAICKPMKCALEMPELGVLPANLSALRCADWIEDDNRRFASELVSQMRSDRVGRVERTGDESLVYRFFEVSTARGWLTHTNTRVATEHTVLKPRYARMPADGIEMPKKAAEMIKLITSCDHKISKHFSVITGMLAAKDSATTEVWKEDSKLKQVVTSRTTRIVAGAAALGAAAIAGASSLASAAGPVAMAVADPAITLGDICFFGWE